MTKMTDTPSHSFRMVRTSYKSQDLIYEEPGHRLVIYLEMSGVRKCDWVGCDTAFKKWTEPKEEEITESHRAEILRRLSGWMDLQKVRIEFGQPVDIAKMASDFEKKGWTVEKRDGGVTAFRSPARRGLFARISSAGKVSFFQAVSGVRHGRPLTLGKER